MLKRKLVGVYMEVSLQTKLQEVSHATGNHLISRLHVSKAGITPFEEKMSAVVDMKSETLGELRMLLGMVQYYARFVPHLASQTHPLREVVKLQAGDPIVWIDKARAPMEQVKQALVNSPVIAAFDSALPTTVMTDASRRGLGALLSQIDENGEERVVPSSSKSLSSAEKEGLACV